MNNFNFEIIIKEEQHTAGWKSEINGKKYSNYIQWDGPTKEGQLEAAAATVAKMAISDISLIREKKEKNCETNVIRGIDDIVEEIRISENDALARAFTICFARILLSKGIKPLATKVVKKYSDNTYESIIVREFSTEFDIDTSEHDADVAAGVIDRILETQYFNDKFKIIDGDGYIKITDLTRYLEMVKENNDKTN